MASDSTPVTPARISVSGTGRAARPADLARAVFVAEAARETAAEARAAAAGIADAVLAAIRGAGVPAADVQTAGLDLSPTWEHDGNRMVRTGFTVTNRIGVTVRDLETVGRVLDAGLQAGATGLDGVTFALADPRGPETEARRAAVADARGRAETIAAAAGGTLGALRSVAEGVEAGPSPRPMARLAAFEAADSTATPVLPGVVEVTVSVAAEWELAAG
jgi:uncharacterized protein YggE